MILDDVNVPSDILLTPAWTLQPPPSLCLIIQI